ncbi:class I SAM-dependent methyltransferase [Tunturiibacter gelidoferens]|uniref:SAM-dependent methyltransferase n=1 Tax=Tunturiibacter lichenicola TaxID=2051959 RepID=A0A7Y9NMG4_9BACT|nr:class I SAM-dependent methyltransferase [Edaphobacter lichenicola]NYF52075.1 SAM-dependent methyltransferase [Edaphobacter lichenicola]
MTNMATVQPQAILAFDHLAERYDDLFTKSLIGRAQRDVVWNVLSQTFRPGDYVLELNCGTGEDAMFLARSGISVAAFDASEQMIRIASQRLRPEAPNPLVRFSQLPIELIHQIRPERQFDGAFSNFSGLNCVVDLNHTAGDLAALMPPGAPLIVCLSTRFCISEMIWFSLRGKLSKAFRRCSGRTLVKVDEFPFNVYYPTLRQLRRSFSPAFIMRSCVGIGITVPPSYVEPWIRKYPKSLNILQAIDKVLSSRPGFRVLGDHMLIRFERVQA